MPMPDGAQMCWIFTGTIASVPTVAVVSEAHAPWVSSVADWEQVRKGKRERELEVLLRYVGWLIWQRRSLSEPTDAMRAVAERALKRASAATNAREVSVVELVYIKGFGGTHATVRRTVDGDRVEYMNHAGRMWRESPKVLAASVAEVTWRFVALEFLPQRPMGAQMWPLAK